MYTCTWSGQNTALSHFVNVHVNQHILVHVIHVHVHKTLLYNKRGMSTQGVVLIREVLVGSTVHILYYMCMLSVIYISIIIYLVHSFVEVTTQLLCIPGVTYVLSERFSQDPVEAFFGRQRYKGGCSDNPSVKEFLSNTGSLQIQGSAALAPLRGNCRRKRATISVDDTPLPKRKRTQCKRIGKK